MLIEDKVAIITGGAKGMGRSIVKKFNEQGCSTAIIDLDLTEAKNVLAEVEPYQRNSMAIQCDVTDEDQIEAAVRQVADRYGRIDILVNGAGGLTENPPMVEMPLELWDKAQNLNLKSVFLFCKHTVPHMQKQSYGKIVNISSIGAVMPPGHTISYNTAKAGMIGFTLDLACEVAASNITVNAILPGPIRTPFYDKMTASMTSQEIEDFFTFLGSAAPMKRVGQPEEIAGVVLFLSSDMSSYVTGEALKVAGGMPLRPFEL